MKTKVQYFGAIRVMTGRNEEEVEISSNAMIYDLLQRLSSIYGEAFKSEIFQEDGQNLRDDWIIAINGTLSEQTNIMGTRMKSGDIITLFPVFPGGG